MAQTRYWLMKTEPDTFSIDMLAQRKTEPWNGVRNFTARNHMKAMSLHDKVLFYHSSCKPPGVAGLATVCKIAYPDPTQFDPNSEYFDPKSKPDAPRWHMVDVAFGEKFRTYISLDQIRENPACADMVVLKRSRLSVQPVEKEHFDILCKLGRARA